VCNSSQFIFLSTRDQVAHENLMVNGFPSRYPFTNALVQVVGVWVLSPGCVKCTAVFVAIPVVFLTLFTLRNVSVSNLLQGKHSLHSSKLTPCDIRCTGRKPAGGLTYEKHHTIHIVSSVCSPEFQTSYPWPISEEIQRSQSWSGPSLFAVDNSDSSDECTRVAVQSFRVNLGHEGAPLPAKVNRTRYLGPCVIGHTGSKLTCWVVLARHRGFSVHKAVSFGSQGTSN
jgi:hypothetical protein